MSGARAIIACWLLEWTRAIEHMHKPDWPASQVMTIMMMTMTAWIEQEIVLYMCLARDSNESRGGRPGRMNVVDRCSRTNTS